VEALALGQACLLIASKQGAIYLATLCVAVALLVTRYISVARSFAAVFGRRADEHAAFARIRSKGAEHSRIDDAARFTHSPRARQPSR